MIMNTIGEPSHPCRRIIAQLRRILDDPAHGNAMRSDLMQGLPTLPIWMQSVVREVFETKTKSPRGRRRPPQDEP